MKITILTLFKKQVAHFLNESIIKRAKKSKLVQIKVVDFRKFSTDKHQKVDDYQFGGGPGMVLALSPIVKAIKKYQTKNTRVVLVSPQGKVFDQQQAHRWIASEKDFIFICGHYEGFDERIIHYVDEVISIGDFILTGGELAALVLVDSLVRLVDHVIKKQSADQESFENNLLDYAVYTRPEDFEGHRVPKVLLSGHQAMIDKFRMESRIQKTKKYRPDLYKKYLKSQK